MEGGKEGEGECSGLFVRKPTQEFESAMAKGGEGNGKGEGRRAGSESEGASERVGTATTTTAVVFVFQGDVSPPLRFCFVALVCRLS